MNKKKIKPNRYKGYPAGQSAEAVSQNTPFDVDFCLKCIVAVAILCIISLASIFVYDLITQTNAFVIKKIEISGLKRATTKQILKEAGLRGNENLLSINFSILEKKITAHPWVKTVKMKRDMPYTLVIEIAEHEPLAIVRIENLSDILINTQGSPFKEHDPQTDMVDELPVITGLDLTKKQNSYIFDGPVFNSTMVLLKTMGIEPIKSIKVDKHIGLTIKTNDIFNTIPIQGRSTMTITMGFNQFKAKLNKAKTISKYIGENFPDRKICSIDLFNIEKVFIKTQSDSALLNTLEKGV